MSNLHKESDKKPDDEPGPKKVSYGRMSEDVRKAYLKRRQTEYIKYRSRIKNRIFGVIGVIVLMVSVGWFVSVLVSASANDDRNNGFEPYDRYGNEPNFSTSRVCPEGSIRSGDLDDRLRPVNEVPVKLKNPYEDSESPERKARDRCVPLHEAVTIVSERLPALHASIDAHNAEADVADARERETLNGILGNGNDYQRLGNLLIASCRIADMPSISYRATPMVDAAPETVKRVITDIWARGAWEAATDTPVYGKTGHPVNPYQMVSEAYDGLWESAYAGMIPQTPKNFVSAKQQVCGFDQRDSVVYSDEGGSFYDPRFDPEPPRTPVTVPLTTPPPVEPN